jgi:protein SCO1/2
MTGSLLHDRRAVLRLAAALAAAPGVAAAYEGHVRPVAATSAPSASGVTRLRRPLPDARLTDAEGRRRRLLSGVVAGRVVAVDFVLTGCASLCNVISAAMAGAQELLAPRIPQEAGLVSIGLDPLGDTPDQLRAYAERFGAGPGWSFVNLAHAPLEEVLRSLGGPEPGSEHAPMVVVLDPVRGELRRLFGLPAPEEIAAAVQAALDARAGRQG